MVRSVVEPIARFGLAARGVVYVVIGTLAARAAAGKGGGATDREGAVRAVDRVDTTGFLITALALGLLAYVLWRLVQAFGDLEGKGKDAKGLAVRAGYAGSGLAYLGLAVTAFGFGISRGSGSMRSWVARMLAEPWGPWAVGLAGGAVIGGGAWQLYRAWSAKFEYHLRLQEMTPAARTWMRRIGRFGLSARGVTFFVVGWFLIEAARHLNAREVRDFAGALRTLEQQPYGAWLMGTVALGLVSYGVLSFIDARYRRIVR